MSTVVWNCSEFHALLDRLNKAVGSASDALKAAAENEGVYAVSTARRIVKEEPSNRKSGGVGLVNTGDYRRRWQSGNAESGTGTATETGDGVSIDVYNNVSYASELEHGFRRHFVPGLWEGNTFHYIPGYKPPKGKPGGMNVGTKPAHNVLSRTLEQTEQTMPKRVEAKISEFVTKALGG